MIQKLPNRSVRLSLSAFCGSTAIILVLGRNSAENANFDEFWDFPGQNVE